MNLQKYAEGNSLFRSYFKRNKESLLKLVKSGQFPKALFIGCSDCANANKDELLRLTEKLSVIKQIENILTYPNVKKRFENHELNIHGWYYHMETGNIDYYNAETYEFCPLKDLT